MKRTKQRIIALDYFRGIFIIMVVINHATLFSMPFAYFTGAGRLWVSAAELLLLISGLTFGIVRADKISDDFRGVYKRTFKRAGQLYLVNILIVVLSLILALYAVSSNLTNWVDGSLPNRHGLSLLWSILNLSYSIGWAGFLGYFAVFLSLAPMALYTLKTRFWLVVPLVSVAVYTLNTLSPSTFGNYTAYALWQIYFVMGLLLARFRVTALTYFYGLKYSYRRLISFSVVAVAAVMLAVSILLEDSGTLYPRVWDLAVSGWLPSMAFGAYHHLLAIKPAADDLLMKSRTGVLRPLFSIVVLAGMYAVFQEYKNFLLDKTGKLVTTLGRNTLWIFAAQAIVIPLLAMLPLQRNNFLNDFMLTAVLLLSMWALTKRQAIGWTLQNYMAELKHSYNEAKYSYLRRYQYEED
jgi:fucose 4-O-acetylase-like acetyltransferase